MFTDEAFELIIVDTSGRHMQDTELFEEMKQVRPVRVLLGQVRDVGGFAGCLLRRRGLAVR